MMNKNEIAKSVKRSKSVAKAGNDIYSLIKSREETFASILPAGNNVNRFVSSCLIAVRMNNKLQQCKPDSLIKAMMESARFGLEPNSPLGEAALVPYGQKVEFMLQYRGLLKLAWNSGTIKSIDYDKVCAKDVFVYKKGFDSEFRHEPSMIEDRGNAYCYYAYAEMVNGGRALNVMTKTDIIKHMKQYSQASRSKSSPWVTDFDAMAIKTVIRQLVDKKLPKATTQESLLLQQAAHIDDIPHEEREEYTEVHMEEMDNAQHESEEQVSHETSEEDFYYEES